MATSRAPCQSCSLPFYTDENDDCPYCARANHAADAHAGDDDEAAAVEATDAEPAGSRVEPDADRRAGGSSSSSLLGSLLRPVRKLFGR